MRLTLLSLLGIVFVSNSLVLQWIYPDVSKDYYQYIEFVSTRNKVYEFMFAGFFLLTYFNTKGLSKSIAFFFFTLAFGSFVDKVFFGVTHYLYSDILLVLFALTLSYLIYARENKGAAD